MIMMLKKKVHQLLAACLALAIMGVPMLTAFAETSIYSEPVYVEGFQKETTPDEEKQESLTESGLESASASDDVTVSFYVGDQLYLTEAIDTNTLARVPQDPAPGPGEGHFVGWFEEDASSPFDFNTIVESDLALTARFSEQYLVQFLDTRGSVVNVSWVAPGAAVSPYDSDALNISADKQFIHWYEEGENPEVPFDFSQAIDRNTRLRPYLKDTLLLVFVSEGTQVPPQVINPQEKVTLPANDEMTRPGYAFRYWSTEKNGKTAYEPDYETASFTLYAVWEKQKVTYSVIY